MPNTNRSRLEKKAHGHFWVCWTLKVEQHQQIKHIRACGPHQRTCGTANVGCGIPTETNFPKQGSFMHSFLGRVAVSSYLPHCAEEHAVWERAKLPGNMLTRKQHGWQPLSSVLVHQRTHGEADNCPRLQMLIRSAPDVISSGEIWVKLLQFTSN